MPEIAGESWPNDDPVNDPDGEVEKCPNCRIRTECNMGMKLPPELERKILERVTPPSPRTDEMSEKEFMAAVVALARKHHFLVFHCTDARKSAAGYPDLTLCKPGDPGQFLMVELKTETGRTTAAQDCWLDALASAGLDVRMWRPSDMAEIEATLRGG